MKKLLVLLLISALAVFVFVGCDLLPSEGEGEGEGEGEVEGVVVEVEDEVVVGGKTYVKSGTRGITVTFPAPVEMAVAYITPCTGGIEKEKIGPSGEPIPLWSEDGLVWTGSGTFGEEGYDCCSSYVLVEAGECEPDVCVYYPVIVDSQPPYAEIKITTGGCICEGCEIIFKSTSEAQECAEAEPCCGDDCSGLAGWSIAIYDGDPFDVCCETPCKEPIFTCSGTACPVDCTSTCLKDGIYYAVVNLVDNVGHEVEYYAKLVLTSSLDAEGEVVCTLAVTEYCADVLGCTCTSFDDSAIVDTDEYIGFCYPDDNCCSEVD
ncbi:MAG: hypothetical protein XD85_0167 [Parcubacteria bacterium 34_609]|nr:MAG: hypothetical protein XD85_0167 [Parcubacteria bacterium 34_609]